MEREETSAPEGRATDWPRAAALFFGVLLLSEPLVHASVLIAVSLLLLLVTARPKGLSVVVVAALAVAIVASGARDGVWYAERAWSVLVGGAFLAMTLLVPGWRLASRALGAVFGAVAVSAGVLATRADAWASLDSAFGERVRLLWDTSLDRVDSAGELTPAMVTFAHQVASAQVMVFPALVALASLAALGIAWWARARLAGGREEALAPLRDFRFNDHLVWLFVVGLLLVVAQWGDALVRVGSNAVVFMSVLYALRGAAVFVFVSGGLSLFGCLTFTVVFLLGAPLLVGVAVLLGIGDTWLDLRARVSENNA